MMEEQVPSFPIYVTLPVWGVVLLFVLIRVRYLREPCATFLLLATWFRYSIATFHQYTYPPDLHHNTCCPGKRHRESKMD